MALFQIEPELDSTGGLDVGMFAQGADEFITGSSANRVRLIDSEGKGYRLSGPRFRGCGGRDGLNRHSWLRRGVHFCRARRDGRGILTSVLGYFPARRTQIPTLAPRRAIYVVIPMTAVRSCSVRFGKAIIGCLTRVDRHYKDDEKRCQAYRRNGY